MLSFESLFKEPTGNVCHSLCCFITFDNQYLSQLMNYGMFQGDVYSFYLFSLCFSRPRPTGSKRLAFCQWVLRFTQTVLFCCWTPFTPPFQRCSYSSFIHRVQLDFSVRFSSTKKPFTSIHPA
ncbi:hypothetical protein FOYG_03622 [Fusarium oxysporum NRRL 32931]|uniref:Uncharacterized protein n=1 Tax=Fusarium oxysporum NRRL 32931 TaxID=660029 RepID=W9J220_FUSOX|nr:hypothetical protein FOYG_03622 [Fusarium oxysporum NRRL 32931]